MIVVPVILQEQSMHPQRLYVTRVPIRSHGARMCISVHELARVPPRVTGRKAVNMVLKALLLSIASGA